MQHDALGSKSVGLQVFHSSIHPSAFSGWLNCNRLAFFRNQHIDGVGFALTVLTDATMTIVPS